MDATEVEDDAGEGIKTGDEGPEEGLEEEESEDVGTAGEGHKNRMSYTNEKPTEGDVQMNEDVRDDEETTADKIEAEEENGASGEKEEGLGVVEDSQKNEESNAGDAQALKRDGEDADGERGGANMQYE